MKIKLRRFTAVLSAMLCMICCVVSAVPAYAADAKPLVSDGSKLSAYDWQIISQRQHINAYNRAFFNHSDNFVIFSSTTYSANGRPYYLIFNLYDSLDTIDYSINFRCSWASFWIGVDGNFNFTNYSNDDNTSLSARFNPSIISDPTKFILIFSTVDITGLSPSVIPGDPNAPVKPFTVSFNPSLKTGLARKGTLIAPGAENDGQDVETNSVAVTVKMTDEFINASKPISGAFTYSYQFTCFVIPSEYKDSDIKTMSEHAIYTAAQDNLNYLYYENETLDIDDSLSSQPSTGELAPVSEQWANATGVSNCFVLERDNNTPLRNVTIDLHNIDFENNQSDSYNIVVLGHIVRKSEYGWTAYPSYFKSDCSSLALESTKEYPMNFGSENEPVTNKNFYEYYSVISDNWSFKDYPKYEPHMVGGVTVGDSPLDFKKTAKGVQDYNMWEQGGNNNTLAPDDFDKYKEQKQLDENFGSTDFGIDSIKGVFDGSSDFFKFLTASIAILPTTFLTILISFFVVMLAICVVKWIL